MQGFVLVHFPQKYKGSFDNINQFVYARVVKTSIDFMSIDPTIRLSVSEAAKMFGVSTRTIRRAIKKAEITYIVVQGRYKINFESLLKWSQSSSTVRNKRDKAGIGQFVEKWRIKNTLYSPNLENEQSEKEA